MRNSSKKISVVLLSLSLLMSQTAYAARMGGSKSSGMQRSVSTAPANSGSNPTTSTVGAAGSATPQKSGMGMGTVLAGAAAGAVGGYLLGKASSNNESGNVNQSQGSQIPWGIIMILGALLAIGLMIFRRKTVSPSLGGNQTNGGASPQPSTNNSFSIPSVNNGGNGYTPGQYTNPNPANNQPLSVEKTADGVEAQYFLRQAKGMFLHIQSMNTPENVSEVEKYMTPELYLDIKSTITANDFVADFSQLDGRLLESVVNNDKYVASVLFSGKVSDSPTSPVIDFNEIWHFVKPINNVNAKWLVAGIQQTSQT